MSFCALPVFLAFILNRCSIRFFTSCRCILGFTPYSASILFGLSLVAILVKHPELYPCCWRRHCINVGDFYINIVESPVGVSLISNFLALALLLFVLHMTKVCNFYLLFTTNGIHKFFADAGLTSKICRHHREMRDSRMEFPHCNNEEDISPGMGSRSIPSTFSRNNSTNGQSPKMLRSGRKIY